MVRFVCTVNVPTGAYAEMPGRGPRSLFGAVTARPVVGIGGDGLSESGSAQHQLTTVVAASCEVRLENYERSLLL